MKRFLPAILAVIIIVGMLVSSCGEAAPAEAPEAPTPEEAAVPGVPEAPEAAPEAAAPTTGPKYGGVLKIFATVPGDANMGWPVDISIFNMLFTKFEMMEQLIHLYKDATVEPMLATDWEFAPDYLSITFDLRRGVKFHDGTDFKADAVKLMFDAIIEEGTVANWESADIIDDYTVRLNFTEFDNGLWENLVSLSAMIISPTAYETYGLEWVTTHPVGTGPFKFVEFDATKQYVKLERFDDYWQEGKPYLDGVEYHWFADATTMEMAFLAGEGHVLLLQSAKVLSDMEDRGYNTYTPLTGVAFFMPDDDPDSPWADKRVREAMEYALDKEGMAEAIGYGTVEAAYQYNIPGNPAYNPNIVPRKYDLDKARLLLSEAAHGTGFKTTLICDSLRLEPTLLVQRCLEEVGIKGEIQLLDMMAINEAWLYGWSGLMFSSMAIHPNWAVWARGMGDTQYVSMIIPEGFPELVDAAIAEPDPDEAWELNQQCLKMLADEAVLIPIWADSLGIVASPKVHDAEFLEESESFAWCPYNAWMEE